MTVDHRVRQVFVADAVHTFHTGADLPLPRAVLVTDGRVAGFADPGRRHERAAWDGADLHDLAGTVLVPGFFDGHNHQPTAARDAQHIKTAHVTGLPALRETLAEAVARTPPGHWISTEHPLTISQLEHPVLPVAADIDAVTPDHPVAVRFGAHTMVLNTKALLAAGIADLDADPEGGVVDRDPRTGAPTGPVREYGALRMVLRHLSVPTRDDLVDAMRDTQCRYAAAGVTSVRVPGLRPGELGVYQDLLRADGRLGNRVAAGPRIDPTAPHAEKLRTIASWEAVSGLGDDWLRLDAVKLFVDGGIETALDGTTHLFLDGPELTELVGAAAARGWSVACHAVTPEAIDLALDAYEHAAGARGATFAVEHGFLAGARQLTRAARLGVWLSTQPSVGFVESALVRGRLSSSELERAFPLRSALAAGVRCALGSDWNATPGTSVRPFSPLESVRAAVTRTGADGLPFGLTEAVDPATALHLHTRAPARLAGFADAGGLWPGALADLVALTADPLTDLASAQVSGVIAGGRLTAG